MATNPMRALTEAVHRRNRQADKVEALVDRLYTERQRLAELERRVTTAHAAAPQGTMIGFYPEGWAVKGPEL